MTAQTDEPGEVPSVSFNETRITDLIEMWTAAAGAAMRASPGPW